MLLLLCRPTGGKWAIVVYAQEVMVYVTWDFLCDAGFCVGCDEDTMIYERSIDGGLDRFRGVPRYSDDVE